MAKIIDASHVSKIEGRKILLDTNIWIFIEGLNGYSFKKTQDLYTKAWMELKKNNAIIINEYVISEYCNRSVRIEYEIKKKASPDPKKFMSYKKFRETEDFKNVVDVTKDSCLNMIEMSEFCSCYEKHYKIEDVVEEFSQAKLDLSDIIIRNHCNIENYILMSDDKDYGHCEIELITGNRHLLK